MTEPERGQPLRASPSAARPAPSWKRYEKADNEDKDVDLSTADRFADGFRTWLKFGSARWLKFQSAPTQNSLTALLVLLKRLIAGLTQEVDRRLIDVGLTTAKTLPLLLLLEGSCSTVTAIARRGQSDSGAMTRTIGELEEAALLQRVRSREDRRVVRLELTERGRAIAATLPALLQEVFDQRFAGHGDHERAAAMTCLRRLARDPEGTPLSGQ